MRSNTKLIGRDLQFRFLARKAVKLGLVKWYNFRIGPMSKLWKQELNFWKEDIIDFLKSTK